jgi:thiol:disulfide interchange protein DsbD
VNRRVIKNMNPRPPITWFFSFLLLTFLGFFQAQAELPANSAGVVSTEGVASLRPIHPGTVFSIAVQLKIKEGWHVNAHEGLPEFFIPAELSLNPGSPVSLVSSSHYPAGEKKALGGATQAFPVYEGTVIFYADVKLSADSPIGKATLPFQLRVQACNNQVCLAPATVPVNISVEVGDLNQPVAPVHPELFKDALAAQNGTDDQENIIAKHLRKNGILITFILIFLGGLALNLTPCVYPMIPITISYFGNLKAEKPSVILGRAVAYVVGISITYSSLGVMAALTGKILGSSLQSPFVLIGISLVLVILSFSMFGLYEIQAPNWLLNKIASTSTQGWLGALGMGLVFGIVAAPCVDPFSIGLLTFVAAKANPFLGFIMFFTLSLGLGFPYIWLGFFSNELQRLPKSGMWMVWVKKVFGLILFGMPLYFLSPLMPKDFNHYAVSVYLLVCGLLLGWVFSGVGVTPGFKKFQRAFGIFLMVMGLLVYKAWPQPVELPFQNYDSAFLQQAQKDKKPVFVDFSASWCLPCKELEVKTFSDSKVHEAFKGWVLLKADLSQYSSGPVEELKKTYGIMGVPTLVFIGPDGQEKKNLRVVGFIPTGELLQEIQQTSP